MTASKGLPRIATRMVMSGLLCMVTVACQASTAHLPPAKPVFGTPAEPVWDYSFTPAYHRDAHRRDRTDHRRGDDRYGSRSSRSYREGYLDGLRDRGWHAPYGLQNRYERQYPQLYRYENRYGPYRSW